MREWAIRSLPNKLHRHLDVGVDAVVNRAMIGCAFHNRRRFLIMRDGHFNADRELGDAAWGVRSHDFFDVDSHAVDIQARRVGLDSHDGCHAARESGGEEVGGREAFAAAVVVDRGIGRDDLA